MISPAQASYIREHAHVPEHLPAYVSAISGAEPFLYDDFVVYVDQDRLTFIGYPLDERFDETRLARALDEATARFEPRLVSVIAARAPASMTGPEQAATDFYYRLDLPALTIPQKVRNMLRRAKREVEVIQSKDFRKEHQDLVDEFLRSHRLDEPTQAIFRRIPAYLKTGAAWLFEARTNNGDLAAFDVAEFGAEHYAFYMFNFRSQPQDIPGASDLLLSTVIEQARLERKRYLNLGLGINPGVTSFKTKWGGVPYLPYTFCLQQQSRARLWEDLFDNLL